jgi:hypothetical protein
MSMAELFDGIGERAANMKKVLDNYSGIRARAAEIEMPKKARDAADFFGATHAEAQAAYDLTTQTINIDKLPVDKVLNQMGGKLATALKEGKVDPDAISSTNAALEKMWGTTYKSLGKDITGNRVIDGIMTRFTTWFGRKDIMKFANDAFISGEMNAALRASTMREIVKGHSAEQISDAWKVATGIGAKADTADPATAQLAAKFIDYFDSMFGASGMSDLLLGQTGAARAQLLMKDVNKHLGRVGVHNFKFRDDKVKDLVGKEVDYTPQGEGWSKSWQMADPKDPVSFFYNVDLAMERVAKEYALYDDLGARFGSKVRTSEYSMKIPHPRLEQYYFNEDIGKQILRLQEDLEKDMWRPQGLLRYYSRALKIWKTGVTIYLPSHHIRNLIGDLHLMWWAGYNDPRAFIKARRIMHSQRSMYKDAINSGDFSKLDELLNKNAMEWANTQPGHVITNLKGKQVTADQYYISAHQHGLLLDANLYEDVFGESAFGKFKPLGGHGSALARNAAEYREHFVRLSHYVAAVEKRLRQGQTNMSKIFDDAAHEVRKWHPDGRDMTMFEQNARLMFPFYSWTRKSIPLMVQAAATRPAKILYYPRMMQAFQGMTGINAPSALDLFPNDQLFPSWIRATGIGPIGDASQGGAAGFWGNLGRTSTNLFGEPFGYTEVNPSNPFQDTFTQFLGMGPQQQPFQPLQGALQMLTPFAKIPIELGSGKNLSTGADIGNDPLGYLAANVPLVAPLSRVTNSIGPFDTKRGQNEGNFNLEGLINLMTALGIHGTAPYIKTAEFEERDRAR